MKLIDSDALFQAMENAGWYNNSDRDEVAERLVLDAPEAIVRCKDCRWGKEACGNIECFTDTNVPPEYHGYEWFCPNGERRTDG